MGNFADSFGEDFLGLRELGIAAEFGLSSLTIPKKLLKDKNRGAAQAGPSAYVSLLTVIMLMLIPQSSLHPLSVPNLRSHLLLSHHLLLSSPWIPRNWTIRLDCSSRSISNASIHLLPPHLLHQYPFYLGWYHLPSQTQFPSKRNLHPLSSYPTIHPPQYTVRSVLSGKSSRAPPLLMPPRRSLKPKRHKCRRRRRQRRQRVWI